jgi:hypothetical protein
VDTAAPPYAIRFSAREWKWHPRHALMQIGHGPGRSAMRRAGLDRDERYVLNAGMARVGDPEMEGRGSFRTLSGEAPDWSRPAVRALAGRLAALVGCLASTPAREG